jgi:hypothetical protein
MDEEGDDEAGGYPNGQPGHVEGRVSELAPQTAQRNDEVVRDHEIGEIG